MYKNDSIIALIPARSGSKGLPGKNIKRLINKPLISWSIEQAKRSKYIDEVIVSTDGKDIAKIAKANGAKIPFMRPKKLATDCTKGIDVVIQAINWFKKHNNSYNIIIILQPTSPLRKTEDIDKAIELLFRKNAKAIVSVCETEYHPYWTNVLPKSGSMKNFLRVKCLNKNRQQLPVFYRLNGAIYVAYCDYILKHNSFFAKNTYAYIMSKERSIDIDTELDFFLAEFLLKKFNYNT